MMGSEPLDRMISFRMTKSESLLLKKLAGTSGHGPYLRRLIAAAAKTNTTGNVHA
jgi:hypothetical protein